jgi:hypothetical protein
MEGGCDEQFANGCAARGGCSAGVRDLAVAGLPARRIETTTLLLPGDAWDAEMHRRDADPTWRDFRFEDRHDYLRDYAERRRPHIENVLTRYPAPDGDLWPPFVKYFEWLLGLSSYFNSRIDMRVGFEIDGPFSEGCDPAKCPDGVQECVPEPAGDGDCAEGMTCVTGCCVASP